MKSSLLLNLGTQPMIKVLRGFITSQNPRHLRDLAYQCDLSPAGVSDILRRLKNQGLLKLIKVKNKKCYSLNLDPDEFKLMQDFFSLYEIKFLEKRAKQFSTSAISKLEWMDQAYSFYRSVKNVKS